MGVSLYSLIVKARNIVGLCSYLAKMLIRAAVKQRASSLQTAATVSNTNLVVSLTAKNEGVSAITAYIIKIRYYDVVDFNA